MTAADEAGRDLVYAGIACGMCCATRYLGASGYDRALRRGLASPAPHPSA